MPAPLSRPMLELLRDVREATDAGGPLRVYGHTRNTAWRLVDRGLLQSHTVGGHDCFTITPAGRAREAQR